MTLNCITLNLLFKALKSNKKYKISAWIIVIPIVITATQEEI